MHCAEAGKALIKFNHCEKYIYSFSVPQCCPLCQQDLGSRKLEDAPVSIANPFTNGHQEKCSFHLRPTQGTFLRYSVFKVFNCIVQTFPSVLVTKISLIYNVWGLVDNFFSFGLKSRDAGLLASKNWWCAYVPAVISARIYVEYMRSKTAHMIFREKNIAQRLTRKMTQQLISK